MRLRRSAPEGSIEHVVQDLKFRGRESFGGTHLGRHRRHLRRYSEIVPSATWRRPENASLVVSAAPHCQCAWSARQPKLRQLPNPQSDESTTRGESS